MIFCLFLSSVRVRQFVSLNLWFSTGVEEVQRGIGGFMLLRSNSVGETYGDGDRSGGSTASARQEF